MKGASTTRRRFEVISVANIVTPRGKFIYCSASEPEQLNCLIPWFDGAILSQEWKEALWAKFVTGAPRPRTLSEQRYSDRKLRSQR
jgi:hypothetical protein